MDTDIYFIQARGEEIKIGWASSVEKRMARLQTSNARPLVLLGTMSGGPDEERILHSRFSHLRVRGEWFRPGEELLDFIATLPPRLPTFTLPDGREESFWFHVVNLPDSALEWAANLGYSGPHRRFTQGYFELIFDHKETADLVCRLWNQCQKKEVAA